MATSIAHGLKPAPRWLHYWAVLTVCATLVLLLLGTLVTTFRVGMADPVWPTYPWHLLLISWQEPSPGFLIEHSHRLAGYIVGCCAIVLCAGLWRSEPRRWVCWLGTAALLCVIIQGLLGGFRVVLNALVGTDLATIHGIFAQIVFALMVSLALFTSRGWFAAPVLAGSDYQPLRRWSLVTVAVLFLQIVLGAILRHTYSPLGQRGHLLVAFLAVGAVAWLVKSVLENHANEKRIVWAALVLALCVAVQVLLGIEAWLVRFSSGIPPELQQVTIGHAAIRTAHSLLGFGVFAAAVVVALRAHRQVAVHFEVGSVRAGRLEGAA